ncbi:hypothetical protein [uncultured Gardnerella sp.]|uniref:hypothetical protein n=1 Tax=uncultured Gardnerella sp. TaxID=293424 RepID=UPI00261798D5|nr:hypothetical protein [uncultured Gardnerella sp.]
MSLEKMGGVDSDEINEDKENLNNISEGTNWSSTRVEYNKNIKRKINELDFFIKFSSFA